MSRSQAKIRALVEQAILKSWRLLRRLRCSTARVPGLVQAVLTLPQRAESLSLEYEYRYRATFHDLLKAAFENQDMTPPLGDLQHNVGAIVDHRNGKPHTTQGRHVQTWSSAS